MDLGEVTRRLGPFVAAHYGPGASVGGVDAMPGHAGLSFGFEVRRGEGVVDRLVLRVPPKGVRRSGNTDVLRQAPLLRALRRAGVPVPDVRFAGEDERWFDVPYLVVERLPGRTLLAWEPDPSFDLSRPAVRRLYEQAIAALGKIHTVDWRHDLAGWEPPRSVEDEIRRWEPIVAKPAEPRWADLGFELRDLLLERRPTDPAIGVFHGDFQPSNFLFDGEDLVAILDWEISGIGPHLLDLGWLVVFSERESWDPSYAPLATAPSVVEIVSRYEEAVGRKVADLAYWRALAGYRFGAIDGFNVRLHRTRKRHDPMWEKLAPSVERLYGRAKELLTAP